MGDPAARNQLTRRQLLAALAGGMASLAGHALGMRNMLGKYPVQHEWLSISDNLPKSALPVTKRIVPQALSIMMGPENTDSFKKDAARIANEYNVTGDRLRAFLAEKTDAISKAAQLAGRYFSSPSHELCYISSSLFVSGWVHGIDPMLMHAIAHVESNFSNNMRSPAGAMGCMQVTINSAIFELHSMNVWRNAAERMLRKNLTKLGGMEFHGLLEEPRIERMNGRLRLSREDDDMLMARPLPNAIWGARTLLLKYRGGRMETRDWQVKQAKVKTLLRRYKGIDEKAEGYANNALFYYQNVYCQLDKSFQQLGTRQRLAQGFIRRKT